MADQLPIERITKPGPPYFRWSQVVDTPDGKRIIRHEGYAPVAMEQALLSLISRAQQLQAECDTLRKQVEGHVERIAAQSELLTRQAEQVAAAPPAEPDTPQSRSVSQGRRGRG